MKNWVTWLSVVVCLTAGAVYGVGFSVDVPGAVVAWGYNGSGQCDVPEGLSDVVSIAAGNSHSIALESDGTVVAWSGYGLLNIPSGLSDVVEISAGGYHSLALKSDGTVVAWGNNGNGECDVPSGLSDVVSIAAGDSHGRPRACCG